MSRLEVGAAAALALAFACPLAAHAGCGSAFCSANTDWASQGEWTEPGGKIDIRFEFIDQDQPRNGAEQVGVGQVPQHHDEVRTINRNWFAQFDYNFTPQWGISASLPFIDRDHQHIHNHQGEQVPEQWDIRDVGDARVFGRYQFQLGSAAPSSLGFSLGLKLPTGKYDVTNDEGEEAERTLQPGSGTTDLLGGVFYNRLFANASSAFAQLRVESAIKSREDYRPGDRVFFDLGYRYPLTSSFALLLQLNVVVRERDTGVNAEPEDTGGKFLFITPGVSYGVTKSLQLYAFVQVPIYQYVNGVQLTSDWAALAGASWRF